MYTRIFMRTACVLCTRVRYVTQTPRLTIREKQQSDNEDGRTCTIDVQFFSGAKKHTDRLARDDIIPRRPGLSSETSASFERITLFRRAAFGRLPNRHVCYYDFKFESCRFPRRHGPADGSAIPPRRALSSSRGDNICDLVLNPI